MANKRASRVKPKKRRVVRPKGIVWNVHINGPRRQREELRPKLANSTSSASTRHGRRPHCVLGGRARLPRAPLDERMLAVPARDGKGKIITRRAKGGS